MKDILITDREAAFQLKKEEHEHRKNKFLTENKKEKLKLEKSYCRCIQNFGKRRTYLTQEGEYEKNHSEDWENYLKDKFEIQRQYEEKMFDIEKKLQYQLEKESSYFEEELKQISFIYNKQMSEKMNHNLSIAITGFFDSAIFTTRMEKLSEFEKEYMENENIRHKFFVRNEYHKFEKEYSLLINLIKSYSRSVQKMQLFEDKNTLRVPTLISLLE